MIFLEKNFDDHSIGNHSEALRPVGTCGVTPPPNRAGGVGH